MILLVFLLALIVPLSVRGWETADRVVFGIAIALVGVGLAAIAEGWWM